MTSDEEYEARQRFIDGRSWTEGWEFAMKRFAGLATTSYLVNNNWAAVSAYQNLTAFAGNPDNPYSRGVMAAHSYLQQCRINTIYLKEGIEP